MVSVRHYTKNPKFPTLAHLGPRLREGMVLALEPMLNVGTADVSILSDNWTVVTADGELSAHFEHTVAVSEDGGIVLSQL